MPKIRDRDIETAIHECARFGELADRYLEEDAVNTPEDAADLRRYALDAIRALRKVRECSDLPTAAESES